jgi:hypothetical protein
MTLISENRAEWNAWNLARHRCRNPKMTYYHMYGGNGIDMCDEWFYSFDQFLEDMGSRPSPFHQLARIDKTGNYEPSNCKWLTAKERDVTSSRGRKKVYDRTAKHPDWNVSKNYGRTSGAINYKTRMFTHNGVTKSWKEWMDETGITRFHVLYRKRAEWPLVDILTKPPVLIYRWDICRRK